MRRARKERQAPPASPPAPPREPLPEDCCGQGCTPCVFDSYAEALARYRAELAAWQSRRRAARKRKAKE